VPAQRGHPANSHNDRLASEPHGAIEPYSPLYRCGYLRIVSKSWIFCYLEGDAMGDPQALMPVTGGSPNRAKLAQQLYSAPELMRLSGMTRKQVSYWAKIGLITPSLHSTKAGGGRPSLFYSAREVLKAMVVCDLRRAGFTPRQVQKVAKNLQEGNIDLYESQTYLLTDGYSVYYAFTDDEVVDVLKNHRQLLLLVPVHEHIEKLTRAA
jgi:DNA-binding transcriptional MerR regulator